MPAQTTRRQQSHSQENWLAARNADRKPQFEYMVASDGESRSHRQRIGSREGDRRKIIAFEPGRIEPDQCLRNDGKDRIEERLRKRSEEHTSELQSLMRNSYA